MKTTLSYLKLLSKNNDRDWFKSNKDKFDTSEAVFKQLVFDVSENMKKHDLLDDSGTKIYL